MRGLDPTILSHTPKASPTQPIDFSTLTVNQQPDGHVTLSQPDGQVLSCQPGGSFQLRPPGTAGAYELCRINGQTVSYSPDGSIYVFSAPEF